MPRLQGYILLGHFLSWVLYLEYLVYRSNKISKPKFAYESCTILSDSPYKGAYWSKPPLCLFTLLCSIILFFYIFYLPNVCRPVLHHILVDRLYLLPVTFLFQHQLYFGLRIVFSCPTSASWYFLKLHLGPEDCCILLSSFPSQTLRTFLSYMSLRSR